MIVLLLLASKVEASSLGSSMGQTIGYALVGLICSIVIIFGVLIIKRPHHKGILSALIQIILFVQFCRYTALINFTHSSFYSSLWKTVNLSRDPYHILLCSSSDDPWLTAGYEYTNFLCNTLNQLIAIALAVFAWVVVKIAVPKMNSERIYDFWLVLVYCSAADLAFFGFLNIKYLSFSGILVSVGVVLGIISIATILIFLFFQLFFVYKHKDNSALTRFLYEEFDLNKEYYNYIYYPILLSSKLLYVGILALTQSSPYAAPIVTSIANLILFSYIVSMKPFSLTYNNAISSILSIIEVVFVFIPLVYEMSPLSAWIIDYVTIGLFTTGIISISIKGYLDYRGPISVSPLKKLNTKKVTSLEYFGKGKSNDLDSSADAIIQNDKNFNNGFNMTFKDHPLKTSDFGQRIPVLGHPDDVQTKDHPYDFNKNYHHLPIKETEHYREPSAHSFAGSKASDRSHYGVNKFTVKNDHSINENLGDSWGNEGSRSRRRNLGDIDSITYELRQEDDSRSPRFYNNSSASNKFDLNRFTVRSRLDN